MNVISFLKNRLKDPEIRYAMLLFFTTRFFLSLIGVLSRTALEPFHGIKWVYSKHLWLDIWGVWDTGWYMSISQKGYPAISPDELAQHFTEFAFFPFYPLLMKILGFILTDNYIAGLLISNVCLIVSCIYLYRLAKLDADEVSALRSVKYLLLFPVSFILSGVFTESLYLMLVLMCFYYVRTDRWHLAGGLGFFLALTRSLGVLIVLPLLYEGLQPLFSKGVSLKYVKNLENLKSLLNLINSRDDLIPILSRLSYLLLIPLGLAVFMAYNYYLTGDLLAFAHAQAAWGRHFGSPLLTLLDAFDSNINSKFEAIFAAVSLSFFLLFYNRIRFSYWIFGIYSILVPLFTGIMSMPRFILVIFPIYLLLADLTEKRVLDEIAILSLALLQGCLMVFWSNSFHLII